MTVQLEGHTITVSYPILRSDTTAVLMFTIPAGSTIVSMRLNNPVVSNAATTATVTVGKSATTHEYLDATDVKSSTGITDSLPAIGSVGSSAQPVYGIYAETGTASTTGGPYTVVCQYTEA